MEKKKPTWVHYAAIGTGISATFAGLMVGGYFLGSFIDQRISSHPFWTIVSILVALVLGVVYLVFIIRKFLKETDAGVSGEDESQDGP